MNRTKVPIHERIGNVPQFPIGVDVAVAEVGTTNRLGFQLLIGTPNPEVEEQQRDDVLLVIGDQIVDLIECPNAGPDDVNIEDVAVEDVVPEGIVVEKDLVEDPNKTEEMVAEELITMVKATTRGKANVVADALSKKERLKMIMYLGEFIRDFEKMEIEVKESTSQGYGDSVKAFEPEQRQTSMMNYESKM
ncbi:hypothetical protein AgCh_018265 [Apium graveolens]